MDAYGHDWLAKRQGVGLLKLTDEEAPATPHTALDESPPWTEPGPIADREVAHWREPARALALAVTLGAWSIAPSLAWGHAGHPHGAAPPARSVVTEGQLNVRSARFDFDPPRPGSYRLPVVKPAADGAVLDAAGVPRRLRDVLAGRITVLSFVYTRCSDANGCPLATAVLYRLHGATAGDPELSRHLRLVTLSFDPGHDTPATMAKYARIATAAEPRSPWEFLTTASDRELAPILAAYGQLVQRPPGPAAAAPTHLLRVFLIDRQQRIRNVYGLDFLDPRLLLADVRTLLLEDRAVRR
jgi:cytochrome oxidase Cu insertion factor (SCO1/SenC/PrrC family)